VASKDRATLNKYAPRQQAQILPWAGHQPRKNQLAPSAHPTPLPQFTSPPPDPRQPHTRKPPPAADVRTPMNRPAMPESHKHQQKRSITNRSGQQYPGEIAAGGPATPEGLPGAKTQDAWGRALGRKPHAKTKEDAVATVIEANHELTHPPAHPLPALTYRSTARLDECHTLPIFTASRAPRLASRLRYSCE